MSHSFAGVEPMGEFVLISSLSSFQFLLIPSSFSFPVPSHSQFVLIPSSFSLLVMITLMCSIYGIAEEKALYMCIFMCAMSRCECDLLLCAQSQHYIYIHMYMYTVHIRGWILHV